MWMPRTPEREGYGDVLGEGHHQASLSPVGVEGPGRCARLAKCLEEEGVFKDGRSLLALAGESEDWGDASLRCFWNEFSANELDSESKGRLADESSDKSDWKKVWHGCKLEALHSIMDHGKLQASWDGEGGDRFFADAPGVYVFADDRGGRRQATFP